MPIIYYGNILLAEVKSAAKLSDINSITIPSSVTSLGSNCFYGCSSLPSITIPSSVTSLGTSCFEGCSSLTSITIPSSVTSLGSNCFSGCSSLPSITIPSSVTSLGAYCFYGCSSLPSITIPSSVTSLGNYCFQNCSALTSVTIPSSITSLGNYCFSGCSRLTKVYFAGNPPTLGTNAFSGLTLTVYHKANNSNWTSSIKTSTYGGATRVTWADVPTSPILALDALTSSTGSNGIKDISGNGYHGTIVGDTVIDTTNNTFVFDGNGDYISVDSSGLLSAINAATGLTYSCSYIPSVLPGSAASSSASQHRMITTTGSTTASQVGTIGISNNGFFIFDRLQTSDTEKVFKVDFSPKTGILHTYTVTMDYINGIATLYIDGVEVGKNTSWWTGHKSGIAHVFVGCQGSGYYCNGAIKNVRIYDRALTSAEVAALHDNTK